MEENIEFSWNRYSPFTLRSVAHEMLAADVTYERPPTASGRTVGCHTEKIRAFTENSLSVLKDLASRRVHVLGSAAGPDLWYLTGPGA